MKLMIFFLIVVCLHVSAAGYGQDKTVTISGKDLSLEKIFNLIKKQTGYVFFYEYGILQDAKPVTVNLKDVEVEEAMKACLWGQDLDFTITSRTISVIKREKKKLTLTGGGNGPEKTVKAQGIVFNEAGQALSGANIVVKETGKGTITNAKGEFELAAVPVNSTLIASFIGYASQQIQIKESKTVQFFLKTAKDELDKVVIQAYGTTTQRLATGNIATVTAEQIERHPVMNVLEALQGQVPGVVVQQTSGYASAPFKVEIRGRAGINQDIPSEPLYIIDGVPLTILNINTNNPTAGGSYEYGSAGFLQNGFNGPAGGQSPLFSINPNDIESVTVLKDADATAIYGSRGARGVILITTKKGKPGKAKLELNVYSGASKVTGKNNLLNLNQYLDVRREAFKNDGLSPDAGSAYDLVVWDTTKSTDWQKIAMGHIGRTNDIEAGLSGGDKINTFRISGDYHHETSILSYSGADQRASIQFNLNHRSLDQRLNLSFTSMYSYTQSDLISLFAYSLLPPDAPSQIFDANGHLNYAAWEPVSDQFPFANILQPYTAKTTFLNSQFRLQYDIIKGLNLSTNLGYSTNNGSQMQLNPIASQNPVNNPKGSSSFGNNNGSRVIIEPQLEYKTRISKGEISLMTGGSWQSVSQDGSTIIGFNYINDALLRSVSNAPNKNANNFNGQYKYAAVFGRLTFNWANKYILNISARRDGSSRFGLGRQFGNFGAIGAAWIFTEEEWVKNSLSFLSYGKLRGSYGTTGSDQIGDYVYLSRWSAASTTPYQSNVPAYVPLQLSNPELHWEVNRKLELALNLGFLNNRINFEASFYRNRCDNQLVAFPLPSVTGFSDVTANSPANVENSGWEITVRAKVVNGKNFDWSIYANGGRNYNKLLSYPDFSHSPYYERYVIGKPLNIVGVLHYTGVDPQTGQYSFQDINKDGTIIAENAIRGGDNYFKEKNILLDGGFGSDLRYKNFQLNLFFTYRQNPFVPGAIYTNAPGQIGNQSTQVLDRWQKPGDNARFALFTTQYLNSSYFFNQSDGVFSNGSYIRLRNLSLSYDLPATWIKKAGMAGCRVYIRGENLFVITKYNGIDPDVQSLSGLPPSKIITGGIQFNF